MAARKILVVLLALLSTAVQAEQPGRPNILLLVAEDMSSRVGAFGDPVALTPNLDALAREGLRLSQAFTTAGVCAPSRAALITGVHQISMGAQHMRTGTRPAGAYKAVPPPEVKAFPELLRAAGYFTFTDSKLDYQFSGPNVGSGPFTIWSAEGRNAGWDEREPDQPFFGLINFMVTHETGTFDPLGHWPRSLMHLGIQLYRAYQFGIVSERTPVSPAAVRLPPHYPDIPSVRREMARHYNNIQAMDRQVGDILRKLERDGLADNTIVIWTTDHGDGLPRAKRELYDSGIKVPMIVHWPESWRPARVVPGTVDNRLISFVDLAPTILALAGAPVPAFIHGRDMLSADTAERDYIYASRDRIDEVMDRQRAVRDHRFKYIRSDFPEVAGGHTLAFRDIQAMTRDMRAMWERGELNADQARWFKAVGEEQLYDLASDPHELRNLAGNPAYRRELERLRTALAEWLARVGDGAEIAEDRMVENVQCDGAQCMTPPPQLTVDQGEIRLHPPVEGASVAYRLDDSPWQIYKSPFDAEGAGEITVKAVRYGWRESEAIIHAVAAE